MPGTIGMSDSMLDATLIKDNGTLYREPAPITLGYSTPTVDDEKFHFLSFVLRLIPFLLFRVKDKITDETPKWKQPKAGE